MAVTRERNISLNYGRKFGAFPIIEDISVLFGFSL